MTDQLSIRRRGVAHPARPALAMRRVSKRFGGVCALDDAALTVLPGEIHGLVGANGSGKSTLIRILAAYHEPDPGGELEVDGRGVSLPLRPGQPRELGMSFVHQDLALVPALTVAENVSIGDPAAGGREWYVSRRRERRRTEQALARVGLDVDPAARLAELRPGEQALVAIARALDDVSASDEGRHPRRLLVLDEPTRYLPRNETERLFVLIRELAARNVSVVLVSHDLEEVLELADRVTVLRDGRSVCTLSAAELDPNRLAELIVGRPIDSPAAPGASRGDAAVSISRLSGGRLHDLSIEVQRRELVGLTGPVGSGFDDVLYLVFGARACRSGQLEIDGRVLELASMRPDRAVRAGIALVPADRQDAGCVASLSLADNVTLPGLDRFSRLRLDRRRMLAETTALLERFDVRPNRPRLPFGALSGGNQQKTLLAKWLAIEPTLLLLDEPTGGVDVAARHRIRAAIRDAARRGTAVLWASADEEELSLSCDRVVAFSRGRAVGERAQRAHPRS
ncbi:MAG: sugar ABC transporter ATP-binding protein [Actinomycetota bacterium]|nr:sugar ABC transporter ATP-binding protein [Actinomycetota bacterium]